MTGLPDYHTHTARCGHAAGEPEDYVKAAQAIGLTALGVADHLPLLPRHDPELTMRLDELDDYIADVQALQQAHPGYVLLGVEADYRPDTIDEVAAVLGEHPFDYVIGSVHFLGGWGFDDPRHVDLYRSHDINELWREYLDLVGQAAETGLFTILGHLDLLKKFGYHPGDSVRPELERLVERVARAGVLVEINTGGLRKPAGEAYPSAEILALLHRAGVAVTFGSDAHRPSEVGRDFEQAVRLARSAGYRSFAALEPADGGGRATIVHRTLELPLPQPQRRV